MYEEKIGSTQTGSGDAKNDRDEDYHSSKNSSTQLIKPKTGAEHSSPPVLDVKSSDAVRRHDDPLVEAPASENLLQNIPLASPGGAKPIRDGGQENAEYSIRIGNTVISSSSHNDAKTDGDGSTKIYTVTLAETRKRLAIAQLYRSERTLQRYCVIGILNCNKASTAQGQEWLVTDESIEQFIYKTPIDIAKAPSLEQPSVTTPGDASISPTEETPLNKAGSTSDATQSSGTDKEILLERMVGMQQKEIEHLRVSHISLTERIHESNVIAQNLQTTILKITGHGDPLQIQKYEENSTDADTQPAG